MASKISEELGNLKKEISIWENIEKRAKDFKEILEVVEGEIEKNAINVEELEKIAADILKLEKEFEAEKIKIFLSGKYDKRGAIMTFIAGQGGRDAEDFVVILLKMYENYFKNKAWDYQTIHQQFSEEAGGSVEAKGERGLKNITLKIDEPYAYGYLKNEAGVHRLVRISPFDAKKLRHTSFVLVTVMPILPEIELADLKLREEDLKIEFFKSSGPGGQNVNKRETAVRITHLPTGLSVASQVERSQQSNREMALKLLKIKILDYLNSQKLSEKEALQKKVQPTWGNQIRSYIFHPYKLVKDLRTGVETSDIDSVLNGELDKFIEAELKLS